MVYRGLHPDKSIRAALADLAAGDDGLAHPPSDASWCEARDRLPPDLWPELLRASVTRLERLAGPHYLTFGRPIYIADGTTVSMPDTPALTHAFGHTGNRHGHSRFPVARVTFIVRAGSYRRISYRAAERIAPAGEAAISFGFGVSPAGTVSGGTAAARCRAPRGS
jgi:hypothetical protein